MAMASPKFKLLVLPSVVTPLMVCLWVKVVPFLVNISTLPACPGATELTAMMSALSFTASLWPNLCADPGSLLASVKSCDQLDSVDPSAFQV